MNTMNTTESRIDTLTKMLEQQANVSAEAKAALLDLYVALRGSAPKLSPDALQAFGKAREVLTRHGA